MTTKEYALGYNSKFGWNVFPVRKDKKPYFPWIEFQKKKVTVKQITEWWDKYPDALIGCVTGTISNLAIIDIDTEDGLLEIQKHIPEDLKFPISNTPKGGKHYFFACDDPKLTNNAKVVPGCDFRANGGYVILPPSVGENGNPYRWETKPSSCEMQSLPKKYLAFIKNNSIYNSSSHEAYKKGVTPGDIPLQSVTSVFGEGRRDNDLFHAANCLIKGGMREDFATQVLETIINTFRMPENADRKKVVNEKIKSVLKRVSAREHNWHQEVAEWALLQSGYFNVTGAYFELHSVTKQEKGAVRAAFKRLKDAGIIEHHPKTSGVYRKLNQQCDPIDFRNASDTTLDIKYPFGIERYFDTIPKNIILVAGCPDSGKTAFLLNMVYLNQYKFNINYFSSEMGSQEMRLRLSKFDCDLDDWKFNPKERNSDFADVIQPNDINIIDYLEIHQEHYMIGQWIKDIFQKLDKGIAVIAIQRKRNSDVGVGGLATLEKPRLYLNMDNGSIKIIKCKNWAMEQVNPNGMVAKFKLIQGCKFILTQDWEKE